MACGTGPRRVVVDESIPLPPTAPVTRPVDATPRASGGLAGTPDTPSPQKFYRSRWIPVQWSELPGWQDDDLSEIGRAHV